MLTILDDYLAQLADRHADIEQALDGLPPEALDWTPGAEMNSLAVLVTHTAGAERYWIGDVAAGRPSSRDRDAEFRVRGIEPGALLGKLRDNLAFARQALEPLTLGDLEATRTSGRDGSEVTVFRALSHALEHAALHAGQIQLTRQLWDQRAA